jgi:hypothetical protein
VNTPRDQFAAERRLISGNMHSKGRHNKYGTSLMQQNLCLENAVEQNRFH